VNMSKTTQGPSQRTQQRMPPGRASDVVRWCGHLVTALCCGAFACTVQAAPPAAPFPSRTVTLVVPYTPASGADIIARTVAPRLALRWGQAVVVENKPGASGNIGAKQVALAAADGHTLLLVASTITMTPAVYKRMPYKVETDFSPVANLAESSYVLAVHPALPVRDMASLIAYAKQRPGKLNYASPGTGTPQHLAMELLKLNAGIDVVHVPYKGIQGALTDLAGGQVDMMLASVQSTRSFVEGGKMRIVGMTGTTRHPMAPQVPTFKEQGLATMDAVNAWYAVLAPAQMPAAVLSRLNEDFQEIANSEEVKAALLKQGMSVRTSTSAELAGVMRTDLARWKKLVNDAGIEAE
jgi:tripartite-type tricarboxylate transporter receptor subunit TctC